MPSGELQVLVRAGRRQQHANKRARIWVILLMKNSEFLQSLVEGLRNWSRMGAEDPKRGKYSIMKT